VPLIFDSPSLGSGPTAAVAIAGAVSEGKLNIGPEVLVTGGGAFDALPP
jgi:hypothetical protein